MPTVIESQFDLDAGFQKTIAFNSSCENERSVLHKCGREKLGLATGQFKRRQDAFQFAVAKDAITGDLQFGWLSFGRPIGDSSGIGDF